MAENTFNDNVKIKGLAPICRLKYLVYMFIDFLILSMLIGAINREASLVAIGINLLIILPIIVVKRAKDIGFSTSSVLKIWYFTVVGVPFFSILEAFFPILEKIFMFLFIPSGVLGICLIFSKGEYDDFSVDWKRVRTFLLLGNYISNTGVQRLCLIFGIILSITFFFMFSRWDLVHRNLAITHMEWKNVINALIGFYVPFFISAIIQWVYNGFKSNS